MNATDSHGWFPEPMSYGACTTTWLNGRPRCHRYNIGSALVSPWTRHFLLHLFYRIPRSLMRFFNAVLLVCNLLDAYSKCQKGTGGKPT